MARKSGISRRNFLQAGGLAAGYSLSNLAAARERHQDINCILLFLVGGPSQIDTWDPKPHAPDSIRGPFRPIHTNVPGIQICEHFPCMARMAHRYAIIRSVHHEAAPIHETGQQLMQTGHLFRAEQEYPHFGVVVSRLRGQRRNGAPPFVILPGPIGNTGVSISHGQGAGYLGEEYEPGIISGDSVDEPDSLRQRYGRNLFGRSCLRARYGRNTFGQSCLLARRLVESGVRLVTVNMFDTVFNEVTWDCHADGGALASNLDDYRDTLCPMFDLAYSALLDDLRQRGLLDTTLVLALGEFGRTPRLNPRGGRDHWPGVWSVLFAGGGVRGGQVIGASDRHGAEPKDRPVTPAEVAATVYHALGVDLATRLPGPDGRPVPLADAGPISELFRS